MALKKDLSDQRSSYDKGRLDIVDMDPNPFNQFISWYEEAKEFGMIESNALTLSTVDSQLRPSSRIVLLKEINQEGFIFYTNYTSQKAKEMEANPLVSALFFWKEHERQVRIQGRVEKISEDKSTTYFQGRPIGSQMGAWVSDQSSRIENRSILEKKLEEIKVKYEGADYLPKPPLWGGYIIIPDYFEFWQGRENRLHDRLIYELNQKSTWTIHRLAP